MAGIDRATGRPLSGWAHTVQSIEVIFTTAIGERVMRRTFGSEIPKLIGENIAPSTLLRFVTAIHVALAIWEPRFALRQVTFPRNTPEGVRRGRIGMALAGEYRPRGHLGDPTPEGNLVEFF